MTIGATPDTLDTGAHDRAVILRNLPQDCQSRADPSPIGVESGYLDGHEPARRDSEGARSDGLHIRPWRVASGHIGVLRMATRKNRSTRRTTKRATTKRTARRTTARKTARKTNWNKSSFKFSSYKKNTKRTAKRSTAKRSARKTAARRAFSYKFSTARRSFRRAA